MKYDFIVIGAGIIGLSTAYIINKNIPKAKILILEKEASFSMHQSGNNSNVIHSGIYYKPGSQKAKNCKRGYELLLEFIKKYKLPYEICGKIIVATNKDEVIRLMKLYERGIANGLKNLKILDNNEIKKHEPYVRGIKAIYVPQSGITDYKLISNKIFELLKSNGVMFKFNSKVISVINSEISGKVITENNESFETNTVINVTGLYSDKIAKMTSKIDYKIIPFRGEYYNLKNKSSYFVKNLIYPVPNPDFPFLGVHFTRRIDKSIESGPNAVLAFRREGYKFLNINIIELLEIILYIGFFRLILKYWKEGFNEMFRSINKESYLKSLQKLIPEISSKDIYRGGAGVRAQAVMKNGNMVDDFLIKVEKNIVNVCNTPSPAATACFAIGEHIYDIIKNKI